MLEIILKKSPFPGIDQPIDLKVTVSEVKFANNQMTPQFVISLPGDKMVPLLNSETTMHIPPALQAALNQVFTQMVQPLIDKLNADYAKQKAEYQALKDAIAAQEAAQVASSHDS